MRLPPTQSRKRTDSDTKLKQYIYGGHPEMNQFQRSTRVVTKEPVKVRYSLRWNLIAFLTPQPGILEDLEVYFPKLGRWLNQNSSTLLKWTEDFGYWVSPDIVMEIEDEKVKSSIEVLSAAGACTGAACFLLHCSCDMPAWSRP